MRRIKKIALITLGALVLSAVFPISALGQRRRFVVYRPYRRPVVVYNYRPRPYEVYQPRPFYTQRYYTYPDYRYDDYWYRRRHRNHFRFGVWIR